MSKLVRPSDNYRESYLSALREFLETGSDPAGIDWQISDFDYYLQRLVEAEQLESTESDVVPKTELWLVEGDEYIGTIQIRHFLNNRLRNSGGHIYYDIRPSKRRMGYGTTILKLGLNKAKELGLSSVLNTCSKENTASRKIIERNGGVLRNEIADPDSGERLLNFEINLCST